MSSVSSRRVAKKLCPLTDRNRLITSGRELRVGPIVRPHTGLSTLYRHPDREQTEAKGGCDVPHRVGIVFALILVIASPLTWIAWWLLAKLGAGRMAPPPQRIG